MAETKKEITLTVRMTVAEKREADACACYLGLPLSTFFRFAARQLFNHNLQGMKESGAWSTSSDSPAKNIAPEKHSLGGQRDRDF